MQLQLEYSWATRISLPVLLLTRHHLGVKTQPWDRLQYPRLLPGMQVCYTRVLYCSAFALLLLYCSENLRHRCIKSSKVLVRHTLNFLYIFKTQLLALYIISHERHRRIGVENSSGVLTPLTLPSLSRRSILIAQEQEHLSRREKSLLTWIILLWSVIAYILVSQVSSKFFMFIDINKEASTLQ